MNEWNVSKIRWCDYQIIQIAMRSDDEMHGVSGRLKSTWFKRDWRLWFCGLGIETHHKSVIEWGVNMSDSKHFHILIDRRSFLFFLLLLRCLWDMWWNESWREWPVWDRQNRHTFAFGILIAVPQERKRQNDLKCVRRNSKTFGEWKQVEMMLETRK